MTVVAALELDDEVPPGRGAGHPERAHRRLGPAVDEADALDRRHPARDYLGETDLARACHPKRSAGFGCFRDRRHNLGRSMTQDQRAEGPDVVDVAVTGVVPDMRALTAHEHRRLASDRAIGAHRTVDPAGKEGPGGDHSAPSSRVISSIGLWMPVRMGVSRTVERRLSVPRSSRTSSPNTARSSVS